MQFLKATRPHRLRVPVGLREEELQLLDGSRLRLIDRTLQQVDGRILSAEKRSMQITHNEGSARQCSMAMQRSAREGWLPSHGAMTSGLA